MVLILYSILITLLLIPSAFMAYRYGKTLMNIEDNLDVCLFFVNERYNKILSRVNRSHLLYIDNDVIKFVNELKRINDDVRLIFSILSKPNINFKAEIGLNDIQTIDKDDNVLTAKGIIEDIYSENKKKENKEKEEG